LKELEASAVELLWTDFLNSVWSDWRGSGHSEDRLDKPEWLAAFLNSRGLSAPVPPAPEDLAALRSFRARLRQMAETLAAGGALAPSDWEELNRVMAAGPVIRRWESQGLLLLPAGDGWAQVMAEIAYSFARTVTEGEGGRIRFCDNPDCRWVFYDETRNRTKRFCDEKLCGNLMKVRRFRARKKEAGST
jgi:predicted RNA-binding Zn ribbon-like protein